MTKETDLGSPLTAWRTMAANASGGASAGPIYGGVERIIAELNLQGTFLDYGAGVGTFSNRLAKLNKFSQVHAVDIMPPPASIADGVIWHSHDLNESLPELGNFFDVIAAIEVIEHLENPRFVMRQLYEFCKPGGVVVVTTPNNESLRSLIALVLRGHFVSFGASSYPAHITALLRLDLKRIACEAGFVGPTFRYSDHGSIPGLSHLTWQSISLNQLTGLRFSDNLFLVCKKPNRY